MSRYRAVYDSKGLLATFEHGDCTFLRDDYDKGEKRSEIVSMPMVMRDIDPYKNMIDGKMITSRSEHRELLRRHNCVEIGNEKMETRPIAPPKVNRREVLHKQLSDMSDRQANKILKQLKRK
jgi:hypothetical protein